MHGHLYVAQCSNADGPEYHTNHALVMHLLIVAAVQNVQSSPVDIVVVLCVATWASEFCHASMDIYCAIWLQALKSMVERCWHKDPEKRPSFAEVVKILDEQMKKVIRTGTDSRSAAAGGSSDGCCSIQ